MATLDAPLKAYIATDYEGESSVVVFGTRNDWALREAAAGQMFHGEAEYIDSIVRAPAFDHLAGQRITAQHNIQLGGMHYECHCGVKITADMGDAQDQDEDGREFDGPAYHALRPDEVWCSNQCRDSDLKSRFEAKALAVREYEMGSAKALKNWPGITITHCGRRHYNEPETLEVSFTFPGICQYGRATWVVGETTCRVPQASVNAWYRFTADLMNAQDRDPGDEHVSRGAP